MWNGAGSGGEPGTSEQEREPVIWQKVEWRQGDGRYVFEVQQGGLHATLASPHGQKLTIPMVAWYGLLDALAASRKTKERSERPYPPRSHTRWTSEELAEMLAAYHAGATIRALAQAHNRSEQAIEAQLAREGLWDRVLREPIAAGRRSANSDTLSSTPGIGPDPEKRTYSAVSSSAVSSAPAARPWPRDYWDEPPGSLPAPIGDGFQPGRHALGGKHVAK